MREMNLPEHWQAVRLGDYIFKPEYGYTASATHAAIGPKFLRITDIQDDSVGWEDVPYCECNEDTKRKYLLVPGDIVVARIGATTGKAYLVDDCPESIFASYLIRVKTQSSLFSPFLSTYFRTHDYWRQIRQSKGGRLKGGVNIPILQNLKIPLPPLPEQRAIAHVLGAIQEGKAARQRELELERERKAALMDHLFSYGTKGEPRKQTEIGEIPESWEVVRLGKIVTLQRGKDLPVQSRRAEDIPIVGSNGIVGWHNEPVENVPIPGVATGRSGSIGLLTYIDQPYWPLNTALYVRDFHGNNPLFVYYWLHLFPFEKYGQGVSVPTLNRNLVHPVPFRLPPLPEQAEIAEILQAFDSKIIALEQEAARLDELFHAMLDELMTGKRSAVPLIDTASVQSAACV